MASNSKQTSSSMASLAGKTLRSGNSSQAAKTIAGSALAQASSARQTGAAVEAAASKALRSANTSSTTRSLAGSVVSQSNRKR